MRLHRLLLMVGVMALALTACTSTPQFEPDPAPEDPVAFEEGGSGLRGIPVQGVDCKVGLDEIYVEATVMVPEPTGLVVCSQQGGPPGRHAVATIRVESIAPSFEPLVSALSQPDEPQADGICTMWADGAAVIYAGTRAGLFRLAIPVDSCGHYQPQARRAVSDVAWVR